MLIAADIVLENDEMLSNYGINNECAINMIRIENISNLENEIQVSKREFSTCSSATVTID